MNSLVMSSDVKFLFIPQTVAMDRQTYPDARRGPTLVVTYKALCSPGGNLRLTSPCECFRPFGNARTWCTWTKTSWATPSTSRPTGKPSQGCG